MEFVVAGPGALDGISKCFSDTAGLNAPEIIRFMTERQEAEFERLGLQFQSLWGRPLQLIDCQNVFCEVSKYARIRHPEIAGVSGQDAHQAEVPRIGGADRLLVSAEVGNQREDHRALTSRPQRGRRFTMDLRDVPERGLDDGLRSAQREAPA